MSEHTITSAQYQQDASNNNVSVWANINGVYMSVPMDTDNTDYQAILEWVADGNTIQDAD